MSKKGTDDSILVNSKRLSTGQLVRYTYITKKGISGNSVGVFYRQTQKGRYIFYNFDRKFRKYSRITDINNITVPDPYRDDMAELCGYICMMKETHDWHKKYNTERIYNKEMRRYKQAVINVNNKLDSLKSKTYLCTEETEQTESSTPISSDIPPFDYLGFELKPAGYLHSEDKYNPKGLVNKLGEGLLRPAGRALAYSALRFYESTKDKHINADIYLCLDDNKYYIPGLSDLYEFKGTFRNYAEGPEEAEKSIKVSGTAVRTTDSRRNTPDIYEKIYDPFHYLGHSFRPAGYLYTYDKHQPEKLLRKFGEGLFKQENRADEYNVQEFYDRYRYGSAVIFLCLENNKHYIPGISDLYEYTGGFRQCRGN